MEFCVGFSGATGILDRKLFICLSQNMRLRVDGLTSTLMEQHNLCERNSLSKF